MGTLNERKRSIALHPIDWIEQGVKFAIVGLMNTGIDLGLYFLLTNHVTALAEASVLAKGISYAAGVVNSYLWNRSWTFKVEEGSWRTFVPFALTSLIGLTVNAAVLWAALLLSVPETLALLIATGSALIWNFFISKRWIFKR